MRWVDHDLVPVQDRDYELAYGSQVDWGVWARPRIESIAQEICYCAENLPELVSRAMTNMAVVRDRFGWTSVVTQALNLVKIALPRP